jgi:hypothetical protein
LPPRIATEPFEIGDIKVGYDMQRAESREQKAESREQRAEIAKR